MKHGAVSGQGAGCVSCEWALVSPWALVSGHL